MTLINHNQQHILAAWNALEQHIINSNVKQWCTRLYACQAERCTL